MGLQTVFENSHLCEFKWNEWINKLLVFNAKKTLDNSKNSDALNQHQGVH